MKIQITLKTLKNFSLTFSFECPLKGENVEVSINIIQLINIFILHSQPLAFPLILSHFLLPIFGDFFSSSLFHKFSFYYIFLLYFVRKIIDAFSINTFFILYIILFKHSRVSKVVFITSNI